MNKLVKAEFFKLFKSMAFRLLLFFSLSMGGLHGLMAVLRVDAIMGYEVLSMELAPDLIYAALICLFTNSYVCDEFSNRTFGMSLLCGFSRRNVFLAKTLVFFTGLLPLVILPVIVSTAITTLGNGFGVTWDDKIAFDVTSRVLCYIFCYLFLGSLALLAASTIQDRIGSFGAALAGMLVLMFTVKIDFQRLEILWIFIPASLIATMVTSTMAVLVFTKRDFK